MEWFETLLNQKCVETRGRKRKTNYREDKLIICEAKRDPFISSNIIKKNLELNVTARTIIGCLVEANLFSRLSRSVPLLKKRHIKARKEFCHKYSAWKNKKWGTVLWTDESKFNIFGSDGKQFVCRPPNKEFDPHYTKITLKFGGGSIMVWGCIYIYIYDHEIYYSKIIKMAATCAVNLPIIKTCVFENYATREIFFLLTKQLS